MSLQDSLLVRSRKHTCRSTVDRRQAQLLVEPLESRLVMDAAGDALFLSKAYLTLLHRPIDPVAQAAFGTQLAQGVSHFQIIQELENTAEFRAVEVQTAFQTILHHPVDAGTLAAFSQLIKDGNIDRLDAVLASSDEYFALHGGTNAGFLNAVFTDALHRPIDPGSLGALNMLLTTGTSRFTVANLVFSSPEAHLNEVQGLYLQILNRPADTSGLTALTEALNLGATQDLLIAFLASSPEFASKDA